MKKEELKESQHRGWETTATILLARKRETNILKMIAFRKEMENPMMRRSTFGTLGSHSKMMASVTKCGCARHMEPPEEEFMMIVVAIVIALMRQNLKKGVYLINRWLRWQTDACVQNSLIVMKMLVEMMGMVVAVMVIKTKTNLASSQGKDGEE